MLEVHVGCFKTCQCLFIFNKWLLEDKTVVCTIWKSVWRKWVFQTRKCSKHNLKDIYLDGGVKNDLMKRKRMMANRDGMFAYEAESDE